MDTEAGKSRAMGIPTDTTEMEVVEETIRESPSDEQVTSPSLLSSPSHTSLSRGSQGQIPMTPEAAPVAVNETPPTPPAVKVPRVGRVVTPPMLAPTMNAHLQRHRPASAEIRAAIDGYDDDFKNDGDDVLDADQDIVEDEDELVEAGPTSEQLIAQAKQECQTLMEANDVLQRKVRQVLDQRNKGRLAPSREVNRLDGAEARYRSTLRQWADLLEEKVRLETHYRMNMLEMQALLDDKSKRVQAIAAAYKHFRMEVAKSAEHSKTGKPISAKLLSQLEATDAQAEEEVKKARLKNIEFSNKLKRLESQIADKEELAEGLHLIDFEQLKIENQSLNEKIEERNEELMKLRKKITSTVQVLTHMKEKLQFVEKANHKLSDELNLLETALASKREELQQVKTQRDKMRLASRKLKETSVYITSSMLLADMQVQKEERERCKDDLAELKLMYSNVMQRIAANNSSLEQLKEEMALASATGMLGTTTALNSTTSLASNTITPSNRSSLGRAQAEKTAQAVHTTSDVTAST